MRPLLALVAAAALGLAACPSSGPKSKTTPDPKRSKSAGKTTDDPPRPPPPVEGIACEDGPCMIHPGTGDYHECLNAGAGTCYQYGRLCLPASGCVLDADGVYRKCLEPDEGRCDKLGDPCEPARRCAFDRAARRYRSCEKLEDGKCLSFGAPCQPGV